MTCVPGVTRGAREGQKETACIIGCVMCEQRRKIWVLTCSCTFMLYRWCRPCVPAPAPPINGRTGHCRSAAEGAPPPAGHGSGVIPCAGRDGSAPTPGWREGRRDEVLGARRTAGSATKLGGLSEDGTFGTDRRLCRRRSQVARCYSFRFRGRQVSRRGGRSPCSHQRRARNPHGRWGRTAQGRARSSRH